ncbi:NDxxF motif lipoprotein [Staphylococcus sp. NRL 16/872]|uniref:NDxxF motif lipoprotein n=1 Tax=Staphylococcus sp. NRL 16/872 TaxID=2930131 RepID=UPI001FB56D8C|nr:MULTISPECIES: NDxxF motif lipoprotein [unclassified Staphylococcus]MCJ1655361.1 NDxxF motif lipoprotein [Staphylococcus sp. NRL 21/187]MCJ1667086.1 NDxxF motif lipoprotein [Staphylococcus sp. NRL 19/737]WEN69564.1 NDxxF motif lipoprotein [Staphylococcus sp. NRL 16/872]
MKKIALLISTFILVITVAGCSSSEENHKKDSKTENKHTENNARHNHKIPKHIFDKTTTNQSISEDTMKKDIKTYLDSDRKLKDATEPFEDKLYSDEKLSEKQQKKYDKILNLQIQNDANFAKYIKKNKLPNKEYEKYGKKISQYIVGVNDTVNKVKNVSKKAEKQLDADDLKEIKNINKDKDIVNGREQDKIEKFLKKKNIETIAFDK